MTYRHVFGYISNAPTKFGRRFTRGGKRTDAMKKMIAGLGLLLLLAVAAPFAAAGDARQTPEKSARIIGGQDAIAGEWPWMAGLVTSSLPNYEGLYCGATLIHSRWAVTAAHCVIGEAPERTDLLLGVNNLKTEAGERIGVKRFIVHPDYDAFTDDADIALVELDAASAYAPISVVPEDVELTGREAVVVGWGTTDPVYSVYPPVLQAATVPIVSNAACDSAYIRDEITDNMVCAGYEYGGVDACEGDSGGPLMIWEEGAWRLAGIVSWGIGCAEPEYFGVYTRISRFAEWIGGYVSEEDAGERLYFPHAASDGVWETTVGIVNSNAAQTLAGVLTPFDASGAPLPGALSVSLGPLARTGIDLGVDFPDSADVAYLTFEADAPGAAGYAAYSAGGTVRAAVQAASRLPAGDIYLPYIASAADWFTRIILLNTDADEKILAIAFNDGSEREIQLAGRQSRSISVDSLFDGEVPATATSATIQDGEGVAGMVLWGTRNGDEYGYLAGSLLTGDAATELYYPQIPPPAVFWSSLAVYNPSSTFSRLILRPFGRDGRPLRPRFIHLPPGGQFSSAIQDINLPPWASWLKIEAGGGVSGLQFFGPHAGTQMAACPMPGAAQTAGLFPKLETDGSTRIALVNIQSAPAHVDLTAYDGAGNALATREVILFPRRKTADFAWAFFGSLPAGTTHIGYSSTAEIIGFQTDAATDGTLLDMLNALPVGAD